MHPIVPYLRGLNVYNRPDYSMIYNCFLKLMSKHKVKYSDKYDWETDEQCAKLRKLNSKPVPYENAKEFFESDPVAVNEAPPPGQSHKTNKATKTTTTIDTPTMDDADDILKSDIKKL